MLAWTIYISLAAVLGFACLPRQFHRAARWLALAISSASLLVAFLGTTRIDPGTTTTLVNLPWVPTLGISYHLAADGISAILVILTALASLAGVLFSWNVEKRVNEFFAFYFLLLTGVFGVFLSFDLFLFFVFYEIAIIPKYFLISIWGSTNKEYGAMKLALYSFTGSGMVLIGLIAAVAVSGIGTFDLHSLASFKFSVASQRWLFPLTFIGFAILAGLWPFHTWAPTGHVAAPTAASMMLAGVVMKLGAYGAFRVAMVLFPQGLNLWQPIFAPLALVGIIYGAAVALTQTDFKFVIGYSSVSHMGFVLLGLLSITTLGFTGAIVQIFSHGIIAGLLFAVVGRMVYDRFHTRDLNVLQGSTLGRALPFAAITFLLAALASMGFPGFSGFIAEVTILMGVWRTLPIYAVISGIGILIGIAFMFRALQRTFFSQSSPAEPTLHAILPISFPEICGATILLTATLVVGIYPRILFRLIQPALQQPIFQNFLQ